MSLRAGGIISPSHLLCDVGRCCRAARWPLLRFVAKADLALAFPSRSI
jgi:hypothetical protein